MLNDEFEMDFVNLSTSRSLAEIGKTPVIKIWRFISTYFIFLWKLLFRKYDLVYMATTVHGIGFLKDCPFMLMARLFCKNRIIHQHNRGMAPYVNKIPYKWLLPMAYKGARVILLSWRLYPDVEKVVNREQVEICPNGIPPIDKSMEGSVDRFENKMPRLLYLSNLVESKGVWPLLDALECLKDKGMKFHCSFVGGESPSISAEMFTKGVEKRGLQECAKYIGPKYREEKWNAYRQADIFILPSMNDCLPLTIIEAMMCGMAVVGSDVGAIPDLVDDGRTGFIISSEELMKGDSSSLADRLERLIVNPELCRHMGIEGRKRYGALFTQEKFEERMRMVLNEFMILYKRQ